MLNPSLSGEGYTHNLCNALSDAGCEVHLYTGPHFHRVSRCWPRIAYAPHIRFYRFTQLRAYGASSVSRWWWQGLRLLGHLWSMLRILRAARAYEIVHLQFLAMPRVDVWFMRHLARRTRLIYTVHNLLPHGATDAAAQRTHRRIYARCHHLIAHTEATVVGLTDRFGVPAHKISKIPHGNLSHLRDLRGTPRASDLGLDPTGPPLVLLLGHLRENKGIDVLLEAAALMRRQRADFRMVIAGSARTTPAFAARIDPLGLADIVDLRVGYVEEEAVATYFAVAAVVALPYRTIDQSGVAIAAASMGRPVVATRIAGLQELVEEANCGLLVPVDDAAELASALISLLGDGELRERLGVNGRRYADEVLAWEPIAARTMATYGAGSLRAGAAPLRPTASV